MYVSPKHALHVNVCYNNNSLQNRQISEADGETRYTSAERYQERKALAMKMTVSGVSGMRSSNQAWCVLSLTLFINCYFVCIYT